MSISQVGSNQGLPSEATAGAIISEKVEGQHSFAEVSNPQKEDPSAKSSPMAMVSGSLSDDKRIEEFKTKYDEQLEELEEQLKEDAEELKSLSDKIKPLELPKY